jgi:hypothetical protein
LDDKANILNKNNDMRDQTIEDDKDGDLINSKGELYNLEK